MTVDKEMLGSFGDLGVALGLLVPTADRSAYQPNPDWFGDPVTGGAGSSAHGLKHVIEDNDQRAALIRFVDDVLGPPEARQQEGTTWVPLLRNNEPDVTIYAVLRTYEHEVHLGFGLDHATKSVAPGVTTRVHVPVFRFGERGHPLDDGGPSAAEPPVWLALGRPGAAIEVGVDTTFTEGPPPGPGLGGAGLTLKIPTHTGAVGFEVTLRDLRLPGATEPETFVLDVAHPDDLLPKVLDLLAGLVRAQAEVLDLDDPLLRPFAALAGLLGLRDLGPDFPDLPLAELPTRGVAAIVEWVQAVLADDDNLDAWLEQLALLVGGTADPAANAVRVRLNGEAGVGRVDLALGFRLTAGAGGHPVLVPWLEVSLRSRTGVDARAAVDLVRIDTATGSCTAVPAARLEAVFGAAAGGGALVDDAPQLRVGTVRTGVAVRRDGPGLPRPAFVLTAHDVVLNGAARAVVDLSTPDAALASGADLVTGALLDALQDLGDAGELVARLLGLTATGTLEPIKVPAFVADPVGALRAYWAAVLQDQTAMADLLGRLSALVRGSAPTIADGSGTRSDPWTVGLADGVHLEATTDGTRLDVDLVGLVERELFGDLDGTVELRIGLASLDFAARTVVFGTRAALDVGLARSDGTAARLEAGDVALEADGFLVSARWRPASGLRVELQAHDLELDVLGEQVAIPLPTFHEHGALVLGTPDWDEVEAALSALLRRTGLDEMAEAAMELLGWSGDGPRLKLGDLLDGDPVAAVRSWLADLLLDCERLRMALGPVAGLLSGFALDAPLGSGNVGDPFRCPVTGDPRAPGLRVWADPGCAPPSEPAVSTSVLTGTVPPEPETISATLQAAGEQLPDVSDLLVGRGRLPEGLETLVTRWAGTDGFVGRSTTIPSTVGVLEVPDATYAELVALGRTGQLHGQLLTEDTDAVVHVGTSADMLAGRPAGSTYDLSGDDPTGPLTGPLTGDGPWFVRLPTPQAAAAARPDRGAVGEMAARLATLLVGRTDDLVLVGYGDAGAAALRAASGPVTDVITVGTPWAGAAVMALTSGAGGDALELLGRLRSSNPPPWPEPLPDDQATPLQRMQHVVDRSLALVRPGSVLLRADAETVAAGVRVHAVLGKLSRGAVLQALGAFVADAVSRRSASLTDADPDADPADPSAVHVAVDVPVIDLDLGGVRVGVGAALHTCTVTRDESGEVQVLPRRTLTVDVHLGSDNGWLVGGPGSSGASADLRWMSAHVEIPLGAGADADGSTEFVLHEVRALGVDRERWVVRGFAGVADAAQDLADAAVTVAVPEVRALLGDVVRRLARNNDLKSLLRALALLDLDDGLDLDALDRLLNDPAATLRALVAAHCDDIAATLRALVPNAVGSGTTVGWATGPATVSIDLASGTVSVTVAHDDQTPVLLTVTSGPAGTTATLTIAAVDPDVGGVELEIRTERPGTGSGGTGSGGTGSTPTAQQTTARLTWSAAGGPAVTAQLWPVFEAATVADWVIATVPAMVLEAALTAAIEAATEAAAAAVAADPVDPEADAAVRAVREVADLLGLLRRRGDGTVVPHVPVAFVLDPAAYVVGRMRSRGEALAAAAYDLLDALGALVGDALGTGSWPLVEGVALRYQVQDAALTIALEVDVDELLDATQVHSAISAGVVLRPGVAPAPHVHAELLAAGTGLALRVDPAVRVELVRPTPQAPLPLYPTGPGLGQAFATAAQSMVPELLNRLAALKDEPAGMARDVGVLVGHLGDALALRDNGTGSFTAQRIASFAADPAAALLAHLPALLTQAAASLAEALNGSAPKVAVTRGTGRATFVFGTGSGGTGSGGTAGAMVSVTLDASDPAAPAIDVAARWPIPDVGVVQLDSLRLSGTGLDVAVRIGPLPVQAGPLVLRPLVTVRAGTSGAPSAGTRLVSAGLALDDAGAESVEVRWTLDGTPPVLAAVDRDTTGVVTSVDPAAAPTRLLSLAVGLAGGVVLGALPPSILDDRTKRMLRGVVVAETGSAALDPTLVAELLDPVKLRHRLERLLWNVATDSAPLTLTIDKQVKVALVASPATGDTRKLGLSLSLVDPTKRFTIAEGDTKVELEVDATWLDPKVAPGVSVYVLQGTRTGTAYTFAPAPAVTVAGLGLVFTKTTGPLLAVGPLSLNGVAVRVYAEAGSDGGGGGAQVELKGLAIAPMAAGGTNKVANDFMSDAAGAASPAQRPVLDPALAVQKHPKDPKPRVSIRGGTQPGPWWVVVQRQLGPLYVERIGLDSKEADGRVSEVSLLFDGRVEIFGLTAAVDQLSITWFGGDLLDLDQWQVDLKGLAVSADLSGISLAGGMLKTVDRVNGKDVVSYVGMLQGRFGIYGLSAFGGYADHDGDPSFFVFGAVTGPIGGPPAFFVTGLGGGLGINRKLKIPQDPAEFPTFPFIHALDPYATPAKPMDQLKDLNKYFGPERGTFWFAAGISFTSFSLVDGIAAVAVTFGNGLEINLLGLARMALPNPVAPLVSIELGLSVRFSTTEGVFTIRAALTDNSWLLYPDVRLTGGFAFAVWWKGPNAGQFVLTIGGYHPDFHVDGYPEVERVGLTWQVSKEISVKGGAYFALTSEALMAGVDVVAVADYGWLWGRVTFGAHGIVYFDPFWYDVKAWATISAGCTVKIPVIGRVSYSINTGADVHVWGPDFTGKASVKFGPASLTVPFGTGTKREGVVHGWNGFVSKYLEDAGGGRARALSGITGKGTLPAATGGNRSAPPPDGSFARPFDVTPEFELTLVTTVPTTRFAVGPKLGGDQSVAVVRSDGLGASLGLNPMRATVSSSELHVTLQRLDPTTGQKVAGEVQGSFRRAVSNGAFPIGVWGAPEPLPAGQTVPTRLPSGDVLIAGNQVTLTAQPTMPVPGPEIDYYDVEAGRLPLPLRARGNARSGMVASAQAVQLPTPETAEAALDEAQRYLFARASTVTVDGLMRNAGRSATARASYRGQVSAPPLFGTLADGLQVQYAETVVAHPVAAPAPPPAPAPQEPRVLGYFAAGSGVAERAPGTTVRDRAVKRRPAPSPESVHTRLGRRLPINLDIAPRPGVVVEDTYALRELPFTAAPAAARSYAVGAAGATSRVAGLGPVGEGAAGEGAAGELRAQGSSAPTLASGDVVVLHAPDHATDVSERRPTLSLGGAGRVTFVRGDGTVLLDDVRTADGTGGGDAVVEVPAGTALAAVQADGVLDGLDGCAGWHQRSRAAALSGLVATTPGAVLVVDSALSPVSPGWVTAGDLVDGAARVVTRFARPVRTLALVVESDAPERVDDMELLLSGARRATGADGAARPARLVMNGTQAVAVYEIEPGGSGDAVVVTVATGGAWRLTGVLGSDTLSSEEVAAAVLRIGVAGASARLTAVSGPGCSPAWSKGGAGDGR